jgi:hypothetical protein
MWSGSSAEGLPKTPAMGYPFGISEPRWFAKAAQRGFVFLD